MFRRLLELMIGVDSSAGKRGLDKFQGQVSKFKGSVSNDLKGAFGPLTKALSFVGIGAIFSTIGNKVFDMAGKVRDANSELEIGTDFIQRWIAVSKRSNIETDQSIDLLGEFTQRIGEAREGEGQLNEMLKRYGVSVRTANGEMKTHKELLREITDLVESASDSAEAKFIVDQAFGGGGNGILRMLRQGGAALEEQMKNVGDVIEEDIINRLADAKADWAELGNTVIMKSSGTVGRLNDFITRLGGKGLNSAQQEEIDAKKQATKDALQKFGSTSSFIGSRRKKINLFISSRTEDILNEKSMARLLKNQEKAKAKAAQAKLLADSRASEAADELAAKLENLEKSLASLKESNRLKEMNTQERILHLEEKRAVLLENNKGESVAELEKLIEAEKILGELGSLRDREKPADKPTDLGTDLATSFAVSSLAAIGGGGLIGPSSSGEGAVLGENRKQTNLLREMREVLKEIERKEPNDGIVLK